MSLKDSLDLIRAVNPEGGYAVLEHEIAAEQVSSLVAAEKRVAKAVAAFKEAEIDQRPQTLVDAQQAVWAYFVQRELCGFRQHDDVIVGLSIPREVLNGLGATRRGN